MTKKLISRIAELSVIGKEGHVPSALSILDIIWVIYNKIINISLLKRRSCKRDFFILSKGHGCLAQYVVLEKKGIISKKDLNTFCKYKSNFGGHPDSNKIEGIECSTGSLGHGFPFAAGVAYGNKLLNVKSKVITLVGDGECNEGSIWETCMIASHHKLNNLICIVDKNKSSDRALKIDDLKSKFKSFGWHAVNIDGHSHKEIFKALNIKSKKPLAIIANTIKGKGINFMENNPEWHHKNLNQDLFNQIILKN
ncbi:transketolase [Candidatus Pelagibacter sp.]|nr:transketolase [Candidatus Pelagibacter sp.]